MKLLKDMNGKTSYMRLLFCHVYLERKVKFDFIFPVNLKLEQKCNTSGMSLVFLT